mgnify:CR=1 FL=1
MSPTSSSASRRRSAPRAAPTPAAPAAWTFLSNHAHVVLCLVQDTDPTVREIAARVGVTERAVHRILVELEEAGYLTRKRDGRRNTYQVHRSRPLRHPIEAHRTIGALIDAVSS